MYKVMQVKTTGGRYMHSDEHVFMGIYLSIKDAAETLGMLMALCEVRTL